MTLTATAPAWMAHGACRGLDPVLFHPARGESIREAKAVCATCTVSDPCLEWALATNQTHGIFGGKSERERRRLRRDRGLTDPPDPDDPAVTDTEEEEPIVDLTVADPPAPTPTNGTGSRKRPCEECGDPYYPVRSDQRYCSKTCRKARSNRESRAKLAAVAVRKPRPARPPTPVTAPASAPALPPGPVDLQVLLGQLLAGCDHWTVEADLGDVHVTISRGGQ